MILLLKIILPLVLLTLIIVLTILISNSPFNKKSVKQVILAHLTLLGICFFAFVAEWGYTEITFQLWLRTNPHRVDFSEYNSDQEVREALFARLPVGSAEKKVRAFYTANEEGKWKPKEFLRDQYGVVFVVPVSKHGNIFTKEIDDWVIAFHLDETTHTLTDIQVARHRNK